MLDNWIAQRQQQYSLEDRRRGRHLDQCPAGQSHWLPARDAPAPFRAVCRLDEPLRTWTAKYASLREVALDAVTDQLSG
ncbi:hypothetical protein [Nocardia sp. bgisy118]|uniref:hypothetical protein n=1 Tax=Nocardia sp. bgisy118 TaxID=3413786 RepID=UPI003F4A3030